MDRVEGDRRALERLLGVPEMAWLCERVRNRVLSADGEMLTGVVSLAAPSGDQRTAATKLVGPPKRPGEALRVELGDVEAILRRGPWPAGLADAVLTLTGPVVDRRQERQREAEQWESAYLLLDAELSRLPQLEPWWRSLCASGGLKRLTRAEATRLSTPAGPELAATMVEDLGRLLAALPQSGVPIAVFARTVIGDAHALDESRPLGRLAAAAVGAAFARPGEAPPSRRDAWDRAGVVLSNVSSTVLALGVTGVSEPDGGDASPLALATSLALTAMRDARAPMLLTLDQVRSGGVRPAPPHAVVHVCENPTIVEVAAARWARSPDGSVAQGGWGNHGDPGDHRHPGDAEPNTILVCTSGQASTAVIELLEVLTSQGALCRYHGDFDWAGLRIARALGARVPWTPWRFTADDYLSGLGEGDSSLRLSGEPVETPWDPELSIAMAGKGIALEEEAVADILAADLLHGSTSA